ncbi:hypothetical protein PFDG_05225 [Plasmodium falciparum Dd2]|uniref:Uncharacterized protein n=1 Tax=Plasmodium falciparum (isolate Dd2) TaxID=57267 RepID=A0A0L7MAP5_PLAF4|nr:hypothetical protein PFDG_05225 [Plasmodium falciparum Dd2]
MKVHRTDVICKYENLRIRNIFTLPNLKKMDTFDNYFDTWSIDYRGNSVWNDYHGRNMNHIRSTSILRNNNNNNNNNNYNNYHTIHYYYNCNSIYNLDPIFLRHRKN